MHISQLITSFRVVSELTGSTKSALLLPLATVLAHDLPTHSPQGILDILLERERLGSTGIGKGIAIPHGRMTGLSHPIAALGRSQDGVEFDALDRNPVFLFIVLLSPLKAHKAHLAALSTISRFLHRASVQERLRSAPDQEALFSALLLEESQPLFFPGEKS